MNNVEIAFQRVREGHVDGLEVDQLLAGFTDGFPLHYLQELIESNNTRVVGMSAWLLSELGYLAAPLINHFEKLLAHEDRGSRFFVLDAILVNAVAEHNILIANALQLIGDKEKAVRWKAIDFTSRLSDEQLSSAIYAPNAKQFQPLLVFLQQNDKNPQADQVMGMLNSEVKLERIFAVIAAARMSDDDTGPIEIAQKSRDEDISNFSSSFT